MNNLRNNRVRARRIEGRKRKSNLKRRYGLPSIMKAVRQNCLDCMCGSASEVRHCQITQCALFPCRFWRSPREKDLLVSVFDDQGNLVGTRPLHEVKEAA